MLILGIDTSSSLNGIGLIDGDRIRTDFTWEAKDNTLQNIILNIDSVLGDQGLALKDIEGLAVGIGPGSWTGVRVGVTVVKMFAYTLGKPVCGVTSLEALAWQAKDAPTLLCPLVDANRGAVYSALYRTQNGSVVKESDYYTGEIENLLDTIKEPILFLGNAVQFHRQTITDKLGSLAEFGDGIKDDCRGTVVTSLALPRLIKGESDDALSLAPLYLRESAAKTLPEQKK